MSRRHNLPRKVSGLLIDLGNCRILPLFLQILFYIPHYECDYEIHQEHAVDDDDVLTIVAQ